MRFIAIIAALAFVSNAQIDPSTTLSAKVSSENETFTYNEKTHVHLVFSTGCDQKRRQFLSASLQLSLVRVGHFGPLTEVISGCGEWDRKQIEKLPKFYPDYRLHFTKDYSYYTSDTFSDHYTAYNKPFGLRDFLYNSKPRDNLAVAFIDADYMLFKPLVINQNSSWGKYYQKTSLRNEADITDTVKDGVALAQNMKAFLGGRWFNSDRKVLKHVCAGKPCLNVTSEEAFEFFEPSGTPYILTRNDWYRHVEDYCNFTVKGRQESKEWMVEMYAYGAAAANNNIKHTLLKHLGPATPEYQNTEYWQFLDETIENPCSDPFSVVLPNDPPIGIHYAMYYGLSDKIDTGYMYYKYRIPNDILECDSMLLKLPLSNEWTDIEIKYKNNLNKKNWKRHSVWLQCTLIKYGNEVIKKIKKKLCPNGYNTNQGIILHAHDTPRTAFPTP